MSNTEILELMLYKLWSLILDHILRITNFLTRESLTNVKPLFALNIEEKNSNRVYVTMFMLKIFPWGEWYS